MEYLNYGDITIGPHQLETLDAKCQRLISVQEENQGTCPRFNVYNTKGDTGRKKAFNYKNDAGINTYHVYLEKGSIILIKW